MAVYKPLDFMSEFARYVPFVAPYDDGAHCEMRVEFFEDKAGQLDILITDLTAEKHGFSWPMHRFCVVSSLLYSMFGDFSRFHRMDLTKDRTFVLHEGDDGKVRFYSGGD